MDSTSSKLKKVLFLIIVGTFLQILKQYWIYSSIGFKKIYPGAEETIGIGFSQLLFSLVISIGVGIVVAKIIHDSSLGKFVFAIISVVCIYMIDLMAARLLFSNY